MEPPNTTRHHNVPEARWRISRGVGPNRGRQPGPAHRHPRNIAKWLNTNMSPAQEHLNVYQDFYNGQPVSTGVWGDNANTDLCV